jgi:hypothetical protein
MVHEFMNARKIDFDGWDRMAKHAYQFLDLARTIKENDIFIYILAHEEESTNSGLVGVRTLGKLLDNKVCIEGKFSIALRAMNVPGKGYVFSTQTDGSDVTKSPEEMFDKYEPNDLFHISKKVLEYYGVESKDVKNETTSVDNSNTVGSSNANIVSNQSVTNNTNIATPNGVNSDCDVEESKKRTRRTKAEMEAARATEETKVEPKEEVKSDPAPLVTTEGEGSKLDQLIALFGSPEAFKEWLVGRGSMKAEQGIDELSQVLINRMYDSREKIAELIKK